MPDQNSLVMEEMRAIKAMHVDSMSKLGELCSDVRALVIELRHTQKGFEDLTGRVIEVEKQTHAMQIENATNRPILEIARSMNRNVWLAIGAAVLAVAGTNYDKLSGGESTAKPAQVQESRQ
jgi:hypothetical protein